MAARPHCRSAVDRRNVDARSSGYRARVGGCVMAGDKPGAPTKYRKEYAAQAEELCALGATDTEMADFFRVDVRTIYNWKHTHPAFFQALRVGKEACDDRVERALYQRAIGYEQDAVKIFMPAGAEAPVYAPYRERVAPDVGAAKLWLTNRRGETWRDKTETDLTVKGDLLQAIEAGNKRVQGGNGTG